MNNLAGIFWALTSALCFAFAWSMAKLLPFDFIELTFWRNGVGFLLLLPWLLIKPPIQTGGAPLKLIFRGFIGTLALLMFFINIKEISLGDTITLAKTEPFFTAILAFVLLREKPPKLVIPAVIIGFIGVVFISSSNHIESIIYILIGLLSAFFAALAYVTLRDLRTMYDPRIASASFLIMGSLMSSILFFTPLGNGFYIPQSVLEWLFTIVLGLSGLVGQIALTKAYYLAPAVIISSIGYSTVAFGILFGYFLGDPLPTFYGWIGICLIVFGGILTAKSKS